uniref:Reverse transcriptase domain-containing protein n=1 Tax=Tanacetum cinerariifolium TaxID=118510 RepID=A0A6L2LG70_TANCI|nr:reverse transcriptase domain-containing protein [Tanacetum cinerariifolium]
MVIENKVKTLTITTFLFPAKKVFRATTSSEYDVFSQPPYSNFEDAFSPNFPDYISASSDYVPASLGKTYSISLNNSFGLVPIASPTLSHFHDDPYMKVMHAYYVNESPIPPPVIMPPSPILSPMFNPQELFLPEELLPPKKRGRDRSSSSTPTLPQEFDIGESSRKTSLERHEEQIEEILNHLDELSLDRIENMEDNIETSASNPPAMNQAAIRQLVIDSVAVALEAQAANMENTDNRNRNPKPREAPVARKCSYKQFMSCQPFNFKGSEGAVGLICWFERTESVFSRSNCIEDCKVKFATGTLTEEALSWWNSFAQPIRIEEAYKITWVEFKKLLIKKYCLRTEVQKMEDKFYHLTVKGNDLKTYKKETFGSYVATPAENSGYTGNRPLCKKCTLHHTGPCTTKCNTYNKVGHMTRNYRNKGPATGSNLLPVIVTCHACGEKGHYANQCRKTTNNNAQGRAYMLRDMNAHRDPNVVTGAAPVARVPYRLAPSEMQELSNQLQELADQAQTEAIKEENIKAENLQGMDKAFKIHPNGTCCIKNRRWFPLFGNLKDLIMRESHKSKYSIHPGFDKMYQDPKNLYWWPNMKAIIAEYGGKCFTCSRFKSECQKPSGLLVQPEFPMWKWERITMDFISKPPKTSSEHDTIWVIVDRLTKSTHFIPTKAKDSMETLTSLYIKEIISRHCMPISIISDHDNYFTFRLWQSLQSALGTQIDMSMTYHLETDGKKFSYNNSYHASIKAAPFEALYGRKCRSPVCWAKVGDVQPTGPEIIHETIEKIVQIRQRLQAARDWQRSYANVR